MTVVIVFLLGALVGVLIVAVASAAVATRENRKFARRMGYVDLTTATREGRDAPARPYDDELSGGRSSPPPTHLRVVKGDRSE